MNAFMTDKNSNMGVGAERSPLGELLRGTAFSPHPLDVGIPLAVRFAGQSVVLLMTARERAATVRVRVGKDGVTHFEGTRQVGSRVKGELVSVLRAEARACGASWVVVSLGSGWQAQFASRALRCGHGGDEVTAHFQLREEPGLFVPKPNGDCLLAAVDHPTLDRSLVFSVKRREVETLAEDVKEAGLGLAAVRIGVASQLESLFAARGAEACLQDVMVTDGLGVLLVAMQKGDFCPPSELSGDGGGVPRQCSNRPGDLAQDVARLQRDNVGRPLWFVGPEEMESLARVGTGEVRILESVRLDAGQATFHAGVMHELHPSLVRCRPPLGRRVRAYGMGGLLCGLLLWVGATAGFVMDWVNESGIEIALSEQRTQQGRERLANERVELCLAKQAKAMRHLEWLRLHPRSELLLMRLLAGLPEEVALERISAQVDEGGRQMSLEFHLLGGEPGQEQAMRSVEQALLGLGYRIGERSAPMLAQRGSLHRWRLIIPPAFEGVRT